MSDGVKIYRKWPVAVAAAFSALLLVMTIAGEAAVRAERSAHIACARLMTTYVAEIEQLVTAPALHGAARRATLEDRLQRAGLRPQR